MKFLNLPIILLIYLYDLPVNAEIKMIQDKKEGANRNIVLIGASYAGEWPLNQVSCLKVINQGNDGEETGDVLKRFKEDAFESNPDAVIVWGFINDLHRNPKEKIVQTRDTAKQNIIAMVDAIRARDKIPVLATEVTLGVSDSLKWKIMSLIGGFLGKTSYQEFINSNVLLINEWIRNYARDQDILVLDIENVLTNSKGNRKQGFAQIDGSHITESAYQAITRAVVPVLEEGLVKKFALCSD